MTERSSRLGPPPHYRPEIDGLRAIAVTSVVIYHAFSVESAGFLGVDVFFAISGYLITLTMLRELAGGHFTLAGFWERRARRILPALFAMLLLLSPVAFFLFTPVELKGFGTSTAAATLFAANLYFWRSSGGYFALGADNLPLLNLWSLGVEEQFYLAYPLLVLLVWRFARRHLWLILAGLAVLSLAACEFASHRMPVANFYLLPFRAWELLAGGVVAAWPWRSEALGRRGALVRDCGAILGILLILAPTLLLEPSARLPSLLTVPVVAGTLLLLAFADRAPLTRALLSLPALRLIGLASYSIYLWHQPLLAFVRVISPNAPTPLIIALVVAGTVAIGIASYRWIEQPFRSRARVSRRPFIVTMIGVAATLLAFAAVARLTQGLPARLPPELRPIAAMGEDYTARLMPCFFAPNVARPLSDGCVIGPHGPVRTAIIGDSHAVALAPGLEPLLAQTGTRAILLTGAGCPPIIDPATVSKLQAHCPTFGRRVRAALANEPAIRVVWIAARWPYYVERKFFDNGAGGIETGPDDDLPYDENRKKALGADIAGLVAQLQHAGKTVVLVYPVPEPGWNVPNRIIHSHFLGYRAGMSPSVDAQRVAARNARAVAMLDAIPSHPRLIRVSPSDELCGAALPGQCELVRDAQPLYFDDDHPSALGARIAVDDNLKRSGANITLARTLTGS